MSSLLISLVLTGIAYAVSRRIVSTAAVFVVSLIGTYGLLPVMSTNFYGLPLLLLLATGIPFFVEGLISTERYKDARMKETLIAFIVSLVIAIPVPVITTSSFFHASSYRNLINVHESTFSTDMAPVDPSQVRIVDQGVASRLGEKKLGEDTALGSTVELGTPNIQMWRGQLYWVMPLNYSGFWKWLDQKMPPGYIMVSATDERDVRMVREVNGKPLKLRYNQGGWFGDHPHRYLYQNGYATVGLTDFTFEIDEDGRPYYVVTRYKNRVGFSGSDADGIILLDAQTGEVRSYDIDDAPAWVDRIQPETFVISQLNEWGEFVHGWWNPSDLDEIKTTEGTSLVYGTDGNSYWYTGMTSVGSDQGTVGFVLVNTRTKDARLYKQAGATETDAKKSAEGQVQEKGYAATFPILYNVGGEPTYFMALKDNAGLVKQLAFVSVEHYEDVGVGENAQQALRNYLRRLARRGNSITADGAVTIYNAEGALLRITMDHEGNYYLLIKGYEDKAFLGSISVSPELPLSERGDVVSVSFMDAGNEMVNISEFDNKNLAFQKTDAQQQVEEYAQTVRTDQRTGRLNQNANAEWESLTPEQKRAALKQMREGTGQ